jgi:hypothetical protein
MHGRRFGGYGDVVDHVQRVRGTWEALSQGALSRLETALPADATGRAVEDGPWNCESGSQIIEVLTENPKGGLSGHIVDAFEAGHRVVVAFRPDREPDERIGRRCDRSDGTTNRSRFRSQRGRARGPVI